MRAALAWRGYLVVAMPVAALGMWHWLWAVALRGPVLYGEGAVVHAAYLARDRVEYSGNASMFAVDFVPRPVFIAANYPPLYFHLAAIGDDPFVTGRVLSIVATLFVAGAIAWRARSAGRLVAGSIALAWVGSVPVLQWGAAVKPDLVALAFAVAAVMALDRSRPRHALAGALVGIAAMAKPTALLPAAAMFLFVARRDPLAALRALGSGLAAATLVAVVTNGPDELVRVHVVDWNALPWRAELAAPLLLVALVVLAVPIVTMVVTRPSTTIVTAYAAGAAGILLLGGREGATINYFLDLSAALALAVAGRAQLLARTPAFPVAAIVQAAVALLLLNPFGVVPFRPVTTGAWGDPSRIAAVASIPGTLLVEDSGLLLANGREPLVDDLFLWSRNRAREVAGQMSFLEGDRVLGAVRQGVFDAVVSEVALEHVDEIGGFEAQRWHPDLVAAVLERYPVRSHAMGLGGYGDGLYVYTRR